VKNSTEQLDFIDAMLRSSANRGAGSEKGELKPRAKEGDAER
jgi:hypothetical protein